MYVGGNDVLKNTIDKYQILMAADMQLAEQK